ncbi:glycosyltransferase [Paenibacillus sp. GP183]|uniref:glycosyltransferase n=1 Tax=Paenibacillus sp. GP183 TaxID=1882751 RepID=UPI001115132C
MNHRHLGDVRPYTALALGLQDLGHRVTLTAPVNFESYVKQFNVPYHSLVGNTQEILESEDGRQWMSSGNVKEFLKALNQITHIIEYQSYHIFWLVRYSPNPYS